MVLVLKLDLNLLVTQKRIKTINRLDNSTSRIKFDFNNTHVIIVIISNVLIVFFSGAVFTNNLYLSKLIKNDNINNIIVIQNWVCLPIYGMVTTIGAVSLAAMYYQIVPRKIGGFFTGIRVSIMITGKAFAIIIIGMMWNVSFQWLWHAQAIAGGIVICLVVIIASLEALNCCTL